MENLNQTCTRYMKEISAESPSGIQREIKIKGHKRGTIANFKHLGAVVSDYGTKLEVLSRIAQAMQLL